MCIYVFIRSRNKFYFKVNNLVYFVTQIYKTSQIQKKTFKQVIKLDNYTQKMGCCCLNHLDANEQLEQNMTDSKLLLPNDKQAFVLKEQGNNHYKKRAYQNAINCYRQALNKNPNQVVYYTNLALAYKANGQNQQAIQIINKLSFLPMSANPNSYQLITKGKLIKARCLNTLTKRYILQFNLNSQLKELEKCIDKNKQAIVILEELDKAKKYSKIDVTQYLNNSIKIRNYLIKIKQKTGETDILTYLNRKIKQQKKGLKNDKNWQKISDFIADEKSLVQQIKKCYQQSHKQFIQQTQQQQQHLIDPITYQTFSSPVIVPSGISYEQSTLRQYFSKGEYKDPITKQKFSVGEKVMVHNHNLRRFIEQKNKRNSVKKQDIQLLVC